MNKQLIDQAIDAFGVLVDALWKATGDDQELVSNYVECQGGDIRAIESTIAALRAERDAQPAAQCRNDGRCQYAIDHGAEGLGHCPQGECALAPSACGLGSNA